MAQDILLPGAVLSLTAQAADRLLSAADGDAALLYLHLLRQSGAYVPAAAAKALKWGPERTAAAYDHLVRLGLADGAAPPPSAPAVRESDEPPEYTGAAIARELENGASPFRALADEVQRRLGKILSTADLKMLYTLYDYLALPAEVILLLVNWCVEEMERKYGPGRRPRMSQIRREGFVWHRLGVDTVEAAEEHLKKQSALRARESALLPLLGITGRAAVEGERKYLAAWLDMGFGDDAIRLAYERTVLKKQSMSWPYMNSILRSWHHKGLHTVEEIQAGDSGYPRRSPAPAPDRQAPPPSGEQEDIAWMKRFLAREREHDGKEGS